MEAKRLSKRFLTDRPRVRPWNRPRGKAVLVVVAAPVLLVLAGALVDADTVSPHLDPDHGVLRINATWAPRGSCNHCHDLHSLESGSSPYPNALFVENSNALCFTADGTGPCHQQRPANYPATEISRIPEGFPEAGYFEYNSGGTKIHGVEFRNRWPGANIYNDPTIVGPGGKMASPHGNDTDMPKVDPAGRGSCLNCHNAHGSNSPFDMLVNTYRGIGGFDEPTYPTRYALCFDCHSMFGPAGMTPEGRQIADYYDTSINDETAGHQIRMNTDIALSWPSHIRAGDKLPCYDCHNAHGSRGYNGEGANAFLISDERPGWANLTDTKNDPEQSRRFCLGCHIPTDGVPGSQTVEGIIMNTLPDRSAHYSIDTRGCFQCHGSKYNNSNSRNVHNPG